MKLEHKFTILAPVDTVWQALLDPERVAPCFPGATVTSVSGAEFAGTVKVRLGPISLQYKGVGRFTETDASVYRTVIEASGTASGGQSTAAATVTASLAENGTGTDVTVLTDLSITGKPAQFGRGLLEDVGEKIIGRFAECLATSLGSGAPDAAAAAASPAEPEPPQPAAAGPASPAAPAATSVPAATSAPATPSVLPASATPPAPSATATRTAAAAGNGQVARPAPERKPAPAAQAQQPAPPVADEIDLLDAAGGAVARRVAPVIGVLTLLVIIIRWVRRH
jgi:uncharacterized protein